MQIGFVGAGNMATGLAKGIGLPVLVHDPRREAAEGLVAEVGGTVLDSNGALAEQADVVVLAHKPAQLAEVAAELHDAARIVSILGATPLAALREAYPGAKVVRVLPSTPVEIREGVVVLAEGSDPDPEVEELLEGLGLLVRLPEHLVDVAMGLMSNAPAYVAVIAEAQIDAGVRHGLPAPLAAELVVQTLQGTAELIRTRDFDTLAVRREVTSPGGSTARGLAALDRAGLRAAFHDALDAVLEGRR